MQKNDIFDTGKKLCEVVDAEYIGGHKMHLRFNNGIEIDADFSDLIQKPFFAPLRDTKKFTQFGLESGTLTWANNIDICPEYIYQKATGNIWAS